MSPFEHQAISDFNPRSREGSDKLPTCSPGTAARFQSTLPRRERPHGSRPPSSRGYFNPRSREGSDMSVLDCFLGRHISIHAPAKGATCGLGPTPTPGRNFNPRSREGSDLNDMSKDLDDFISIHAPAKGATGFIRANVTQSLISIHAPAKGATPREASRTANRKPFQSTLPRRERPDIAHGGG